MDAETTPRLTLTVAAGAISRFLQLLGQGFTVKQPAGASVEEFLCRGCGIAPDYLRDRIQTVFLNGKAIAISAKKGRLGDVLGKIAKTASLDGYTVSLASKPEQKVNVRMNGAWNKVLAEVATKNHLSLVVKDTTVFVLPYDPAAIKREVLQTAPVTSVP